MVKNNKKLNSRKAFTLIEVVIAIGIFAIVAVGSTGAFASAFKSYKAAKNVNQNLENAQYAMNLMTKTFRTSSIMDTSSTDKRLEVCDYSQNACLQYEFTGGFLMMRDNATPTVVDGICTCGSFGGSATKMTTGIVDGSFDFIPSGGDEGTGESSEVGKITVVMDITSGAGSESTGAKLQSTVSLRDYQTSNIGIDPNNNPN